MSSVIRFIKSPLICVPFVILVISGCTSVYIEYYLPPLPGGIYNDSFLWVMLAFYLSTAVFFLSIPVFIICVLIYLGLRLPARKKVGMTS